MDDEKFDAVVNGIHDALVEALGLEFQEAKPALICVMADGTRKLLDINKMCDDAGCGPADIVHSLKPAIKADDAIYGTVMIHEAWMLKGSPEDADASPELKADLKKIQAGEMSVSESKHRIDSLGLMAESRNGYFKMYHHELDRSAGFTEVGPPEVFDNKKDGSGMHGRLCGFFK